MVQRRARLLTLAGVPAACVGLGALAPATALAVAPVCADQTVAVPAATTHPVQIALTCSAGGPVASLALDPAAASAPAHGAVSLPSTPADPAAPVVTYTPNAPGPVVDDAFTYVATNPDGTDTATVTLKVAPSCSSASATTTANSPVLVTLSCTGPVADFTITTPATFHGSLTRDDGTTPVASGTPVPPSGPPHGGTTSVDVAFWPAWAFAGSDQFTFTARNGTSTSLPATASLTVQPPPAAGGGGAGGGVIEDVPFEVSPETIDPGPDNPSAPSSRPPTPFVPASAGAHPSGNVPRFGNSAAIAVVEPKLRSTRAGLVRLRLRNANSFTVRGRLSVEPIGRATAGLRLRPRTISLPPGKAVTVSLRLTRAQRGILARLGRAKLRAVLTVRDGAGVPRTTRTPIVLRAAR